MPSIFEFLGSLRWVTNVDSGVSLGPVSLILDFGSVSVTKSFGSVRPSVPTLVTFEQGSFFFDMGLLYTESTSASVLT